MDDDELVVIGAGAAGLAAAHSARKARGRVVLVEKARPAVTARTTACVPSKTLLDVAHRVAGAQAALQWGPSRSVTSTSTR